MTDHRITTIIADAIRLQCFPADGPDVVAKVAAEAYEAAREIIPNLDQPTRFVVKGRGVFPADMLRHDHCWPVDDDLNRVTDPTVRLGERKDVTVTLCAQSGRRITPARWRSFGWVVTEIDGQPTV